MLERTMSAFIKKISSQFPVLLLTGMRQIGKSTLLKMIAEPERKYISLDDLEARILAQNDPKQFIQTYAPPIIIDEIQYAPQLFPYIKLFVDSHQQDGLFWLTGSQKFHLMQGIQESLAGRVIILDMLGFSYKETMQKPFDSKPFLPSMDLAKYDKDSKELSVIDIYKIIWDGSFPKLLTDPKRDRKSFYRSYLQTYIERDIKDFQGISNELKFYDFIRAVSARTANLLNYNELAKDVDIDVRTAKLWLSALERSGMVKLLEPYYANITKRIIKTPKIYFLDTGLCAYLTAWDSPESLMNGAMNGAILETYVFTEILKSYWHNGDEANIFFYRDTDQREIDFVIEKNMTLYPMDVKKTASPSKADMRAFKQLQKLNKKVGDGAVICLYPTPIPIDTNVLSFPVWEI